MKINNVEYKNIYRRFIFDADDIDNNKCFICTKSFVNNEEFFKEDNIYNVDPHVYTQVIFYPVCTDCVKSPEEAEKIIIPLLKIMYGELHIRRFPIDTSMELKDFKY